MSKFEVGQQVRLTQCSDETARELGISVGSTGPVVRYTPDTAHGGNPDYDRYTVDFGGTCGNSGFFAHKLEAV